MVRLKKVGFGKDFTELIHKKYENILAIVIDGGYGKNEASTIIDCTGHEPEIIREGVGDISII